MTPSIWRPRWWVFLPVILPLAGYLWFRLGFELNLPLMVAPDDGPQSDPLPAYPAWIISGYYAVAFFFALVIFWGAVLMNGQFDWIGGANHVLPSWIAWIGIAFGTAVHCLVLYGALLISRLVRRRKAAQPSSASFS